VFAEIYFAPIINNSHLFRKPFSDFRDAPDMLNYLGYLIYCL